VLRAISFLLLVQFSLAGTQGQNANEVPSLTGTVWSGTVNAPDATGKLRDYPYTFRLLSGNRLRWHWEGSDFTNGTWRQTGNAVRLELNDGYSTWSGTFDGKEMSGSASNKLGHKWKWALTRKDANASADGWVDYSSTSGRFRALMPSEPEVRDQPIETPVGKIVNHALMSQVGESVMVVAYSDYPQSTEDPQVVLDRIINATVVGIGGTLVKSGVISLEEFPGREYEATTKNGLTYHARIYLVNRRLYQVVVVGPPHELRPDSTKKFMESFELKPSQ
jgi:hypothetical protein